MALARRAYLEGSSLEGGGDDWTQRMPQVEALAGFMQRAIA